MVALQILILPVGVRVPARQPLRRLKKERRGLIRAFFVCLRQFLLDEAFPFFPGPVEAYDGLKAGRFEHGGA